MTEQEPHLNIKEKITSKAVDLPPVIETDAALANMPNEKLTTEIPKTRDEDAYDQTKTTDHQEIVRLIAAAERELADLKLRKSLMEADFANLLTEYNRLIVPQEDISVIAKKTLLEYFSYELLRPLHSVGLRPANAYDLWESKHFIVNYQLDNNMDLDLSFKIDPVDNRYTTDFMPLIKISPKTMKAEVVEAQVLELIRLWHAQHVFSLNQLTLVNYDLNLILNNLRKLGFDVKPSLLDNTQVLKVELESEFPLETSILDDIFITAMENDDYDFEKVNQLEYQVLLDQNQRIDIQSDNQGQTKLYIDSDNRKRSILDFFTNYPFLVPLMVREV